jgi:hypothetical protein
MLATLTILPLLLMQQVPGGDHWVRLSTKQTPPRGVVRVDYRHAPRRTACQEVAFASNGADVISESQFTLIVEVVVNRSGRVERFRFARKPPWPIDFEGPVGAALSAWRYDSAWSHPRGDALEFAIAMGKPNGASKTQACEPERKH